MKKKLIEVALPLEAISAASAREKTVRVGHPSNLHFWWARKPLAAARAILFASLVDDPSSNPERFPTLKSQEDERQRLFRLIEELATWENTRNERVIAQARLEISASVGDQLPVMHDPFAGGGTIPLEALRLGLPVHASDLNPVAVLLNRAMLELPQPFLDRPPANPVSRSRISSSGSWSGAAGIAEDVRYYAERLRDHAAAAAGSVYPPVRLADGTSVAPIAWVWARTVTCPNPACRAEMPLVRSFDLSQKKGREHSIRVKTAGAGRPVTFEVVSGPAEIAGTVTRTGAGCVVCGGNAPLEYVRTQAQTVGLGVRLMSTVAEGRRGQGRVYLSPDEAQEQAARSAVPAWVPDTELPTEALGFRIQNYGMRRHSDLFTARQLLVLGALAEGISSIQEVAEQDAILSGTYVGANASGYAKAIATYLGLAVSGTATRNNALVTWMLSVECPGHLFSRSAISMAWGFAEANTLTGPTGSFLSIAGNTADALEVGAVAARGSVLVDQRDARDLGPAAGQELISTDPPYYDNVPYGDLSDFYYVWLRRCLQTVHPDLFRTLLTPKAQELLAEPARYGGRDEASAAFEQGLLEAFRAMREAASPDFPLSIYYAFKQAEEGDEDGGVEPSSGWSTLLTSLLGAGFAVEGTWPIRTERQARARSLGSNAMASSILLVCRTRSSVAGLTDRRGLLMALRAELPDALRTLQHGNIAPVDLAQAALGPGMAVFSRFSKVVEPDGTAMSVRAALALINQVLGDVLSEQEDEFDSDTRWAVTWFEQRAHGEGPFGDAEVLSKAKNTGVNALRVAGIIVDGAGRVRLKRRAELDPSWDPGSDKRLTVWEVTQHLILRLEEGGELAAADLVRQVGGLADTARDLAYRLYAICERKKWADDALGYNALVTAWPEITRLAASSPGAVAPQQTQLFS